VSSIDLSSNALTGTIPDTWAKVGALEVNLAGNKLSGSISKAWATASFHSSRLNVSGNAGMKGCLADVKGQPWESLPFIDASGTQLLDCIKRQPALTQFGAPQAGWSPASCDVAGYELKVRQLPTKLYWQFDPDQRVLLRTIQPPDPSAKAPFPLATLAETAAACDALDECVMFTSDGYLVGAYRPVTDVTALPKMVELKKRLGRCQWRTMRYCSCKCCGTWVSTGFDAKTLAGAGARAQVHSGKPVNASAPAGPPNAGGWVGELNVCSQYIDPDSERCIISSRRC
jgi:hypothetical protein